MASQPAESPTSRPPTADSASTSTPVDSGDKNAVAEKIVKLIAVGLKEASTDSPSFRASVNFQDASIGHFEQLIKGTIEYLKRFFAACSALEVISSDFSSTFDQLVENPAGLINEDVTTPCLESTSSGISRLLKSFSDVLRYQNSSLRNLELLVEKDFEAYYETKRAFDILQRKYDSYLQKFMAQPKTLEPAKAREDAFQLFEMRKQYIHISLSLCILTTKLEHKISTTLVDVCDSLWNTTSHTRNIAEFLGLKHVYEKVERAKYCVNSQLKSYKYLLRDLVAARTTSEEGVTLLFTPSSDLNSYNPATIGSSHFLEGTSAQSEKHGWVFMKSTKLHSREVIWVKRWLFIKDEVFGFLALSSNGKYVEESDKIGILLANFRYCPTEERRFCFEIKTYQTDLVLQVETSVELKSWLTAFRSVKARALERNSPVASSRYEPLLDLLKLKPVVSKDYELVSLPTEVKDGTHDLINQTLPTLDIKIKFNPPLVTQYTNLSCLSRMYLTSTDVPSALTANVWGFVNWGLYYSVAGGTASSDEPLPKHVPFASINLNYPSYYPVEMRVLDLQLRSIFESYVGLKEFALCTFKALWSPNSKQELLCVFYVTTNHIYVYTNNCGLISISPISLTNFLYADSVHKDNYDVLRLYTVSGVSIKFQLFFDSGSQVKDQLNYLIRAKRSTESHNLKIVVNELNRIKAVYENVEKPTTAMQITSTQKKEQESSLLTVASSADTENELRLNYGSEMTLLWSKKYDLPAKALFHVLVGDQSFLLQSMLPFAQLTDDINTKHTLWRCDSRQRLTRNVWNVNTDLMSVQQQVEVMSNNKYYNFLQSTPYLILPFGSSRRLVIRFIIFSTDSRSSKLLVYYKVTNSSQFYHCVTRLLFKQIILFKVEDLDERILASIKDLTNEKKKIVSAIKLYGPITKYDSDTPRDEEVAFVEGSKKLRLRLLVMMVFQKLNVDLDKLVHDSLKLFFKGLILVFKSIRMNYVLIITLVVSLVLNIYLTGKTTYSYWLEKHTEKYVNELIERPTLMKRAIFLTDIEDLSRQNTPVVSFNSTESLCFKEFRRNADITTLSQSQTDNKIKSKLAEFGMKRNEILTELTVLNSMEKSYLSLEWRNWVTKEFRNCDVVKNSYPDKFDRSLADYCMSVEQEVEYMTSNIL